MVLGSSVKLLALRPRSLSRTNITLAHGSFKTSVCVCLGVIVPQKKNSTQVHPHNFPEDYWYLKVVMKTHFFMHCSTKRGPWQTNF